MLSLLQTKFVIARAVPPGATCLRFGCPSIATGFN
jgi:hypothetical protein